MVETMEGVMKRKQRDLAMLAVVVAIGAVACAPANRVERVDPNTEVDLSGYWNDTDANMVARAMIKDCVTRPWSAVYKQEKGRKPVVRVYPVRNRSSEHVDYRFFTKQLEQELMNSGVSKVVADSVEAADNRAERAEQEKHASVETKKANKRETGSDFVLNGWVVTQNDAADGQEVRAYVVTLELSNTETNEKVWMKVHKIKKVVQRSSVVP
jgi:PBP1b-binding outer membrane lipoprotein LpoB